jgi:PKD repeat protein
VGELARFTLSPASLFNNPKVNVSVDFGDGTIVRAWQPVVTHRYRATGHYKVNASVVLTQRDQGDEPSRVVPRVSLVATPNPARAGDRVSFTAQLASNYPGIKYRFNFGDGSRTDWQDAPNASHPYAAGGPYLAYVDLGLGNRGAIKQVGGSIRQPIVVTDFPKPTPDPSPSTRDDRAAVELTANPTSVQIGSPVIFSGRVTSGPSNVRYRFFFGSGAASTGWQTDSQASYAYSAAGEYPARVEIGRWNNGRVTPTATSNPKVISVTALIVPTASPTPTTDVPPGSSTPTPPGGPTPYPSATGSPGVIAGPVSPDHKTPPLDTVSNNWWVYLLILLLLGFVGYQVYRSVFVPRASLHPNLDMGTAEVDATAATKGLSITSQVLMRPNLSGGQYSVQADEGNIVRSVRRENV